MCMRNQKCLFIPVTVEFLPCDAMLSAVYTVVVCPSVCVCVSITLRYCIKTAKHGISDTKVPGKIRMGSPLVGATNAGGVGKISPLSTKKRCNSKTVQDRRIVSIKVEYAIYQMAMFPMTWVTLSPPNHPNFCIFRRLSYPRSE